MVMEGGLLLDIYQGHPDVDAPGKYYVTGGVIMYCGNFSDK